MSTNPETSTEATHLQHAFTPEYLTGMKNACIEDKSDDLTAFEKELNALTLETPDEHAGYEDDRGGAGGSVGE